MPSAQGEVLRRIPYPEDVRPTLLAIVVGIDRPERTIFDTSRTERDTIRGERRKVSVVELIQVYATGIEIHQAPAIEEADLDEAQLAPVGRQIPLLDNTTADAARILDLALAGGAVVVAMVKFPPCW